MKKWKIKWEGIVCEKCPFDLWIYQEILHEIKPDWIIECGTKHGGTTLFLARILDIIGKGHIVSIDINYEERPKHSRITYHLGNSVHLSTFEKLPEFNGTVLVILDSAHTKNHVYKEMELYGQFVSKGSYLIVEDTNLSFHPIPRFISNSPWQAVSKFLKEHPEFMPDRSKERFGITFNPRGYLKKL